MPDAPACVVAGDSIIVLWPIWLKSICGDRLVNQVPPYSWAYALASAVMVRRDGRLPGSRMTALKKANDKVKCLGTRLQAVKKERANDTKKLRDEIRHLSGSLKTAKKEVASWMEEAIELAIERSDLEEDLAFWKEKVDEMMCEVALS